MKTNKHINNLIIIKGANQNAIEAVLRQWLDISFPDGRNNLEFELYNNNSAFIAVVADERLINMDFFSLISFFYHQLDGAKITGYASGKEIKKLKDKDFLVCTLENDIDECLYIATTKNTNYWIDPDGRIVQLFNNNTQYYYPENLILENPKIIKANDFFEVREKQTEKSVTIRYIVLSLIALLCFCFICLSVKSYNQNILEEYTAYLGIAIVFWFMGDYKMLRINRFYFISLTIAIMFFVFLLTLDTTNFLIKFGLLYPLVFLVFQQIVRRIFLYLLKKEPKPDRFGSTANKVYEILLVLFPIAIAFGLTLLI